jgi:RNA polymerase sigma factor (sigma-70 family)
MDVPSVAAELYQACRASTEPQRTEAYQRLGRLLYRVAWQRVRHDPQLYPLAEEAMQETLAIVWQRLSADQGPAPEAFVAWASAIVVNKVREGVRRLEPTSHARRTLRVALSRQVSLDAPTEPTGEALGERLADRAGSDMDVALEYGELQTLIAEIQGMDELSEPSKVVLLRGFIEGMDDTELAELLDTSRSNVHVIRCRDLVKLRAVAPFMARLRGLYGAPGVSDEDAGR